MRRASVASVLVLALFCAACEHATALVITGETLDATGQTFVATASAMDSAYALGKLTGAQYGAWADFGQRFQASFSLAVKLWTNARQINDAALQGQMAELLGKLAGELATYVALVRQIAHSDGGS